MSNLDIIMADPIDGYTFYPNKDSYGYDLIYIQNKTIFELKEISDKLDNCAGFNTYGYLKRRILDQDIFIDLPAKFYKEDGLYVKNSIINNTPDTNKYKILCLNLKRRPDRRQAMAKLFEKNGVLAYEFFDAIDGKELKGTDECMSLISRKRAICRRGVIGCSLSHYEIWKKLLADNDTNNYLVFEDDIQFNGDYFAKFNEILGEIPKNMDILYLGISITLELLHANYSKYRADQPISIHKIIHEIYGGGFFAYLISKQGAKKILDYIDTNKLRIPIDWIPLRANMNLYETHPHIIFSDSVQNSLNSVDSDIQHDWDSLQFQLFPNNYVFDDYTFYPNKDSDGNDITNIDDTNIIELKKFADSMLDCVAFNTYGWFKKSIHAEINFVDMPNKYYQNDGLYVKNKHF